MDGNRNADEKATFWKKTSKTVPGRPSPKKDVKSTQKSKTAHTSFQDFQDSVRDAWNIEDDEFWIVSETKISKKISQSAALNVLNQHRTMSETQSPNTSISDKLNLDNKLETIRCKFPGRPQLLKDLNINSCEYYESKLDRFEALLSISPSLNELCQLSWSGIPVKVKPITWRLLSGYLPVNLEQRQDVLERKRADYWSLVKQYYDTEIDETYQATYHQIHIDMPRMNPNIPLFQQYTVQRMFERILFIWAIRHPASGYVQGMNDLVTPFYVVFLQEYLPDTQPFETFIIEDISKEKRDVIEADSFWCLSKFLDGIQDNYVYTHLGIQRKVNQLKELIQRVDNTLHKHLVQHNVDYLQFSFRWLNNLLTRELSLRCTIRLWDTYLAESDSFALFQLYVCAAFLLHWREQLLLENDFQGLLILLQNLPTQKWTVSHISMLVAEAYRLKVIFADAPNHLQNNNNS